MFRYKVLLILVPGSLSSFFSAASAAKAPPAACNTRHTISADRNPMIYVRGLRIAYEVPSRLIQYPRAVYAQAEKKAGPMIKLLSLASFPFTSDESNEEDSLPAHLHDEWIGIKYVIMTP
jgi:hypothetical protein